MNLGDIQIRVFNRLNLGNNPDSAVQRRIRDHINDVQREVLTKKNIGPRLRSALLGFNTSDKSPFCTLPQACVRVFVITDRTNNNLLDEIGTQELRWTDPGLRSSSAIPYRYVLYTNSAVAQQPLAATQLFVVSDSTSDGSGLSANVEGITSDGQSFKANVALNGTTPAAVSAVVTWSQITKFYLSAPAAGHVSLQDNGTPTIFAQISPGRMYARYSMLHMYPNTTLVLALSADCELHIEDMVNSADEPILPEDFHDILITGALANEYSKREKGQFTTQLAIKNKRVAELQAWLKRPTGVAWWYERNRRFSQLGPFFPAGS